MSTTNSLLFSLLAYFVFNASAMANDSIVAVTGSIVRTSCLMAFDHSHSSFGCSNQTDYQHIAANKGSSNSTEGSLYQVYFENIDNSKKLVNINYY